MRTTLGITLGAALALSGCFFESADHGGRPGSLIVDWTVGGSKHPLACSDNAADAIDITLRNTDGGFVDEFESTCEDFSTRVQVAPGNYDIEAVLLDPGGFPTTTAVTDHRYVGPNETGVSLIDFPLASFF